MQHFATWIWGDPQVVWGGLAGNGRFCQPGEVSIISRGGPKDRKGRQGLGWMGHGLPVWDQHECRSLPAIVTRQVRSGGPVSNLTCPLKTNPNLERESKDSGVCKEAGNDEEAIHERTDYPQAEGSRS